MRRIVQKKSPDSQLCERGQAALVDSLFFITIVAAVCASLFFFATNYGYSPQKLLDSFYSSDFAMDSLKVINYINVFRDGTAVSANADLSNQTPQFDYMLALIKEDFARNNELSSQTQVAVANTLHSTLRPFDSSIAYVFFISKPGITRADDKFVTMILSTRKCTANCEERPTDAPVVARVFYSCKPVNINVLEKFIFPYAGTVDSAVSKVILATRDGGTSNYVMGLNLWVDRNISKIDNIRKTAELPPDQHDPDFDCSLLPTLP